ncbi:MAG: hypothetical protein ACRDRA_16795 [Pseudonocardiaceae bacterium]
MPSWVGVADDDVVPNTSFLAAELADLLAAECEAGARDPYRQVAALLHLAYSRGVQ